MPEDIVHSLIIDPAARLTEEEKAYVTQHMNAVVDMLLEHDITSLSFEPHNVGKYRATEIKIQGKE